MELLKAGLLGVVQGLTEFLPVSSSGHLVICSELLGFTEQSLAFDTFLHLGTLLAVIVVFRAEIIQMILALFCYRKNKDDREVRRFFYLDLYIILSTLPAVVVALCFKDNIEVLFTSSLTAYCMLIVTGLLLIASPGYGEGKMKMNWWRAVVVGCAQACAIFPGLSRSGLTIVVGMIIGIPREEIARFSFLMSIPAIFGATVLQGGELFASSPPAQLPTALVVGVIMSSFAGYLAIKLLLDIIRRNRLAWFGYYCLLVAAAGIGHYFFSVA